MSTPSDVSKVFEATSHDAQHQSLIVEAVRMLTTHEGGLSALTQVFERNGLGHIVSSWIGNGDNASISPDQIKAVLGSERLADLAKRAGISPDTATRYLSNTLPSLVDALTPTGTVGGGGDLLSRGKEILAACTSTKQGPQR